jgi:antitoxin ChpS
VAFLEEAKDRLIEPSIRRSYTLDELLAERNPKAPLTDEDRAWASGGPIGRELI